MKPLARHENATHAARLRRAFPPCFLLAAFLVFGAAVSWSAAPPAAPEGPLTLVLLAGDSVDECRAVQAEVVRLGGWVRVVFLPSVIVAHVSVEGASAIAALPNVVGVRRDAAPSGAYGPLTRNQEAGLAIWNDHFMGLKHHDEQALREGEPGPKKGYACGIPVPAEYRDTGLGIPGKKGYGAGFYSTSEYLILDGGTSDHLEFQLNIVFPESNGAIDASTETWTNPDMSNYITEAYEGVAWWEDRYVPARITTSIATTWQVPIPWEPINHAHTFEATWVDDLMDSMSSGGTNYYNKVRNFDNTYLVYEKTCWSATLFVVNSKNDADGNFTDGWFDYSYLGGPFLVMTYDNGWRGNGNTDYMAAHESGHLWYALDEYASSGCTDYETTGYLNVVNGNCENGGGTSVECIMRNNVRDEFTNGSVCTHSRSAVGWRDTDADTIPDIVDHPPVLTLNGGLVPSFVCDSTPTYTGTVVPEVEPNMNPFSFPSGSSANDNISVNSVKTVEYRVDGGAWQAATPSDGEWDEADEAFTFEPDLGIRDVHYVNARAKNSRGLYSAIRSDTVIYGGGWGWDDGFEDGSASDWTIVNGGATISLDNTTAHAGTWSIRCVGNAGAGQGATANSPDHSGYVNLSEPYTISFWFRWSDFHWARFLVFGHVRLILDYPTIAIRYDPVGDWSVLGYVGNAFNTYVPQSTWREVVIAVSPSVRQYTITIGGVVVGTVTYNATVVAETSLSFADHYSATDFLTAWYDDFGVTGCHTATSVPIAGIPESAGLRLFASPNPFGPAANVRYELATPGRVSITVYDVSGRLVRTLLDGTIPAGSGVAAWDGRNSRGEPAPAGVYFVRMRSGGEAKSAKILLVH